MEINSGRLPFDLHFRPASPLVADGGSHLYRYAAESQPQRFGISGKVLVAIHFMPMKIMSQTLLLSLLIPCNFWEQGKKCIFWIVH
ncbi:WD domain, G-beta repeat [Musa troglodytarum]|uniref:WD domain, G-beta repeat n=1 Tax=Musa troglodytarum TaxID=320322 RepID=A0A9E7G218_9LILI|nr:WD domain, G-beta repeat [Musa troglodytarum]